MARKVPRGGATALSAALFVCLFACSLGTTSGFSPSIPQAHRQLGFCWTSSCSPASPFNLATRARQPAVLSLSAVGGDGVNGGGGGGGGGGDGSKDDSDDNVLSWNQVLSKYGKSQGEVPQELLKAVQDGKVGVQALVEFFKLSENNLIRPLLALAPIRDRLLADSTFMNKAGIDMIVGGVAQLLAEFQQRQDRFQKELDFVVAGVVTVLLANFAAVYSTAPTLIPKATKATASAIGKWFSSCPDNAFQMVLKGQTPPALAQRVGALFKPMPQLFVVGFIAAAGGYAYTAASVALRKWLDPSSTGGASLPPDAIAKISVAIGAYVAVSTNWRYQVVAGVFEARMFDVLFAKQIALRSAGSTLVRTANTYLGSYWIVSYLRALDLQKIDG